MALEAIRQIAKRKTPRLGILGGTFDPVHNGHIEMCDAAIEAYHLDCVWLLVTGDPPHKGREVSPAEDRFRMAELACKDNDKVIASRLEIDRPGQTYTVDTLEDLKRQLPPSAELYYIIGADTFYQLHNWKRYPEVLEFASFITIPRAGYGKEELRVNHLLLSNYEMLRISLADTVVSNISSTDIRRRTAQGLSIGKLVPPAVEAYIAEKKLYTHAAPSFEQVQKELERRLTPHRFLHTMGVVDAAAELADRYGHPPAEARWAGLLHDCAKEEEKKGPEQLQREYGLSVKAEYRYAPQLMHAPLAAIIARKDYAFYDEGVLEAIASHTTGHTNMGRLDKILLVADMIEESRGYEGVDGLRSLADRDLDEATLAALDAKIAHVVEKKAYLSMESVHARQQLWLTVCGRGAGKEGL